MHTFQFNGHRAITVALLASVLLWNASPLLALDLFGSGKSEEQAQTPAGRSGPLPSLADTAKHASPAVVNISTTQKVERFTQVKANQILTIREGSGIVASVSAKTK